MNAELDRAFGDAAQLLARRVGLRLDPASRRRLSRCVRDEAADRGADVESYVATLDADADALQGLLNRVTVQETSFFRDPVQFDAFTDFVLPTLTAPFTIWSAGSANGQEPYSIAMLLEERGIDGGRVLTTDVSTRALARTREGLYSDREIGGLSPDRRHRFLVPTAGGYSVTPDVRARVEIAHHNLVGPGPAVITGTCPVIFCRNVLIYFSPEEIVALLERFAELLPAGGWLFLGYSESLWQVTDRFELVRLGEAFVYRRRGQRSTLAPTTPTSATRKRADPKVISNARIRRPQSVSESPRRPKPIAARAEIVSAPELPAEPRLDELLAAADAAMAASEFAAAIAGYRKCAYLDPTQPVTQFNLGLALEASGDSVAARRAYLVARADLDSCDEAAVAAALDGYPVGELARLLDRKLVDRE